MFNCFIFNAYGIFTVTIIVQMYNNIVSLYVKIFKKTLAKWFFKPFLHLVVNEHPLVVGLVHTHIHTTYTRASGDIQKVSFL